ncbi:MAG: helix-turn-helix transcriptional regulator [Acetobacteraceae bacterium]
MWRQQAGLTLQEVAKKMGVATSSVHKWEVGRAPVSIETLQRLARLFETDPAALLFDPADQGDVDKLRIAFRIVTQGDPATVQAWIDLGTKFLPAVTEHVAPEETSPAPRRGKRSTRQ